ncbi:phosphatidylinositol-glycan biosynthesis class X protein [Crotalus adamanteus]|uniref:Phosphatidylinositol-glycan biosynthesis class X protein n=1 Tax=Crotalus adamanteus TaxID=8729 RepID=A0AAW1BFV0_CROAD
MPEFLYAQNTCPEISQQLLKDGFHRDLLIRVDFGIADEGLKSCKLAIKVHLPRGLYVDPYELKSLQQHNLTEALVITDEVDLEVPEYLATDSSVLIYMRPDPKCITCFKALLPLHCRYYSPSESDGKILVVLQSPEIMIYCQKSFFSVNCLKETEIEAPCSQKNLDVCYWKSMKYKMLTKELELQLSAPEAACPAPPLPFPGCDHAQRFRLLPWPPGAETWVARRKGRGIAASSSEYCLAINYV